MMGRREGGQVQFLYAFDLDKVVPPDHLWLAGSSLKPHHFHFDC